ncbi:MAG: hypothetical protein PHV99_02890 [Candidatus Pacebacteria bacterium]|nr:hypothetical protein [Candidatus Paceibacterota bacterium]
MEPGSLAHTLARAEYFLGLLTKTTDPVFWEVKKIEEALAAVALAAEKHSRYKNALAAAQAAFLKSI